MVHLVAIGRVGDALALLAAHDAMQHGGVGGGGGMGDNSSSSSMLMDGSGYRGSAPPASVLPQVDVWVWVWVGVGFDGGLWVHTIRGSAPPASFLPHMWV
jgi:hypothetical protein